MNTNTYTSVNGGSYQFAIVRARFNEGVTQGLLDTCVGELEKAGVKKQNIEIMEVPGALEVPYVVQEVATEGKRDAVIALAAVIEGATPHFDYISRAVTDALVSISLETKTPIISGVITCHTQAQAEERSGKGALNRGKEAAFVALEMADLRRKNGWG